MNKNGLFLPNTIWEQILDYSGWSGSISELACTIGNPSICSSGNPKEWWSTGCIRTKILDKSGKPGEETLIPDGQEIKGRRLKNKRDIDQREFFRKFTYYRSINYIDPLQYSIDNYLALSTDIIDRSIYTIVFDTVPDHFLCTYNTDKMYIPRLSHLSITYVQNEPHNWHLFRNNHSSEFICIVDEAPIICRSYY